MLKGVSPGGVLASFERERETQDSPIRDEQDPRDAKMILDRIMVQISIEQVLMKSKNMCICDGFSKKQCRLCDSSRVGVEDMKEETCQQAVDDLMLRVIEHQTRLFSFVCHFIR